MRISLTFDDSLAKARPKTMPREGLPMMMKLLNRAPRACVLVGLLLLCAPPLQAETFYDSAGNSLETFEATATLLRAFFGQALPERVTVERIAPGRSRFSPGDARVLIAVGARDEAFHRTVAHETAHLATAALSRGASLREDLRFIDEGLAEVLEARATGRAKLHRSEVFYRAIRELETKGLTLDALARWKIFANTSAPRLRKDAYAVAASLVYLLLETWGEEALRAFLRRLGEHPDLGAAVADTFHLGLLDLQSRWVKAIDVAEIHPIPPRVLDRSPAHRAVEVSPSTRRLSVRFNVPMDTEILCVSADCKTGICYRNASWRSDRELIIDLPDGLMPGRSYRLALGSSKRGCRLESRVGDPLPVTPWTFRTLAEEKRSAQP